MHVMSLARRQKKATLKNLRDNSKIFKKIEEKENKDTFKRVFKQEDLCVIGVCDASYH